MSEDARQIALNILNHAERNQTTLDEVIGTWFKKATHLSQRDRALITQITFGVLRWRYRLDWILQQFSKMQLSELDPSVLNVLRMALFQISYLDRVPNSAAVNTAVEMTKQARNARTAGFVNGVLRNMLRHMDAITKLPQGTDSLERLALEVSFPPWLIKRWVARLGLRETKALCEAVNQIPPITIRTNTLKVSRSELITEIANDAATVRLTDYVKEGVSLYSLKKPLVEMEAFQKGWFQVQDEAAQIVSCCLAPQPDESILDACAGLGGKTGHMAQLMNNRGRIIALDHDRKKLNCLMDEMRRLGVTIVSTMVQDLYAGELSPPLDRQQFDRILLDAPCSGIGVIRRNPDIKWRLAKKNLSRYKKRQLYFLEQLAPLLKPGGTLVYAVCSIEPEESGKVLDDFLCRRADFSCATITADFSQKITPRDASQRYWITYPHLHNLDGFTIAVLKRGH